MALPRYNIVKETAHYYNPQSTNLYIILADHARRMKQVVSAQVPVDQLYICRFRPAIYSPHERLQKSVGEIQYSGDMRTNPRITCIYG